MLICERRCMRHVDIIIGVFGFLTLTTRMWKFLGRFGKSRVPAKFLACSHRMHIFILGRLWNSLDCRCIGLSELFFYFFIVVELLLSGNFFWYQCNYEWILADQLRRLGLTVNVSYTTKFLFSFFIASVIHASTYCTLHYLLKMRSHTSTMFFLRVDRFPSFDIASFYR